MYQVFKPTILNSHSLLVNGVAVQIYRQASKLTTSPGYSLRLHIEITCDYITLYPHAISKTPGDGNMQALASAIRMALHISSLTINSAGGKTYIEKLPLLLTK